MSIGNATECSARGDSSRPLDFRMFVPSKLEFVACFKTSREVLRDLKDAEVCEISTFPDLDQKSLEQPFGDVVDQRELVLFLDED